VNGAAPAFIPPLGARIIGGGGSEGKGGARAVFSACATGRHGKLSSLIDRRWIAAAGLVFVTQLVLAHVYCGFYTGDEVEVLSEAFRTATDYDYASYAGRNTLVPRALVAPWLWIAIRCGVDSPATLVVVATIPFALVSSLTILVVAKLATAWIGDAVAAHAAATVFALHWLPLGFGSTTYPRVLSMFCVTLAALLVTRGTSAAAIGAGALTGVAFADRYSEVVFLVPLLLMAGRRAWQVAASAVGSIALTSGVYEWAVWGSPFHSFRTVTGTGLIGGDYASAVKHQPWFWYLSNLTRWCAPTLLVFLWAARRAVRPLAFVAIPLVCLSFVAHKEVRYLQTAIPFLAIAAGIGFAAWDGTWRRIAIALLAMSLAWNLWGLRFLGRETRPAVEAARAMGADASLRTIALGQNWAYGDRIYVGNEKRLIDVGTPIHSLDRAVAEADAIAVYESDVTPDVARVFAANGFRLVRTFRAPRARDVVVYRRGASRKSAP